MCCVLLGGGLSACLKIEPGATCGSQDQACGQPCSGQLESACRVGQTCREGTCTHACLTDSDCLDCQGADPAARFQCLLQPDGELACEYVPGRCASSAECHAELVCAPVPAVGGKTLEGRCLDRGSLPSGAACDPDQDDCRGVCADDTCTELCASDADCPADHTCRLRALCRRFEGSGGCRRCQESWPLVRLCVPRPAGSQAAGAPCSLGEVHPTVGDCQAALACRGGAPDTFACDTDEDCQRVLDATSNPTCVPADCGRPARCGQSYCTPRCGAGNACPAGLRPVVLGTTGATECWCFPRPELGPQQAGEPCRFNQVNAEAGNCEVGLACLGLTADVNSALCDQDEDCHASLPPYWNPDCVQLESLRVCGASFCSAPCVSGRCSPGFEPYSLQSGECYCLPDRLPGTQGPGEPCALGTVHTTAGDCQPGLTCLGLPANSQAPGCRTSAECVPPYQQNWNPDCVNGRCGASYCAASCGAGNACSLGFTAEIVSDACYCVPRLAGNAAVGEACPMGNVNPEAELCQADAVCVGAAATSGSPNCTLDEHCQAHWPANHHPDCVGVQGWGRCGFGYCARLCDPQAACPALHTPVTESGLCYCRPEACVPDCP
jgi:hypothetical protein